MLKKKRYFDKSKVNCEYQTYIQWCTQDQIQQDILLDLLWHIQYKSQCYILLLFLDLQSYLLPQQPILDDGFFERSGFILFSPL